MRYILHDLLSNIKKSNVFTRIINDTRITALILKALEPSKDAINAYKTFMASIDAVSA